MSKIIKADLYKISRTKGFYITVFLFIILTVLQTLRGHIEPIDIFMSSSPSEMVVYIDEFGNEIVKANKLSPYTGDNAPLELSWVTDNLVFFMIPILIFISSDISCGAIKNALSMGISRSKLYLSKLALSIIICGGLLTLHIVIPIVLSTVINGFGGRFNAEYLYRIISIYLPQFCLLLVFLAVGIFLIFTFKKTSYLITGYLIFTLLPVFTANTPHDKFAFMTALKWSSFNEDAIVDLPGTLIFGSVLIAVLTAAGILLFRKSEIK